MCISENITQCNWHLHGWSTQALPQLLLDTQFLYKKLSTLWDTHYDTLRCMYLMYPYFRAYFNPNDCYIRTWQSYWQSCTASMYLQTRIFLGYVLSLPVWSSLQSSCIILIRVKQRLQALSAVIHCTGLTMALCCLNKASYLYLNINWNVLHDHKWHRFAYHSNILYIK